MKKMLSRFDIYIANRTWWAFGFLFFVFVLAYPYPSVFGAAKIISIVCAIVAAVDFVILVLPNKIISAKRILNEKWSISDENTVRIEIKNNVSMFWYLTIIDELPVELQLRNFEIKSTVDANAFTEVEYKVKPMRRGLYHYGAIRIFVRTPLGFFSRRVSAEAEKSVAVYPSIFQMKKYSLLTISKIARFYGVKKMRRIGHSYEFEQIKDYVQGDDIRHVNWRATGRATNIKTNHFTEERAQPVYCLIDKSRSMNMAFDNLTLLDYSINAALVISNTALQKGDRAGLITFSDKVGTAIRADNSPGMLNRLLDSLYLQKYRSTEADYEFLYNAVKRVVNSRSLLFLFLNFESLYALQRVLPVLRKMNNNHLLVVIFFENEELEAFAFSNSLNLKEIYSRNVARQMVSDKRQMANELNNHGIQCIVSKPKDLSINSINKYLELKAKGLI
jgi:uncharacterized protein (DUF58 family)